MRKVLAAAIGILVLVSIGAVVYRVGWGAKAGPGSTGGSPSGEAAPPGASDDWAERFKAMTVEDSFAEVSGLAYEPYVGVLRGARGTLIAAIEKFPFTIYDAAGKVVSDGEAGGEPESLPPGNYKVVVKAGSRDIVAPRVAIGLGQAVTLKITMKNGQLVIE